MRKMIMRALGGLIGVLPATSFGNSGPCLPPEPDEFPKNYFAMPVGPAIRLSGTFGELRSDHFHAGIDLSSVSGKVGMPVYAAADGFIDRVLVEESGYGKALYIKHPNGYTTVYGHLDGFTPEVEAFVKDLQYQRERFDVNLYPQDGRFKVKKGEKIGRMGNTGGSEGPHLHFEIRYSANQKALNPLLFGLPVADDVPPELRDMKVYFLNEQREVLSSRAFPIEQRPDGSYGVKGDTVRLPAWRVGFGLKTIDRPTGNLYNKNGIYALSMEVDGQPSFQWKMDGLKFEESRFLNAHSDYSAHERYGAWFHRCFVLPGDQLSNYTQTESLGAVTLYKDRPVRIVVRATDADKNQSTITFWALRAEPVDTPTRGPFRLEMPWNVENQFNLDDFSITIPKNALYETLYFQYEVTPAATPALCAPVHHVHRADDPLHSSVTMAIRPDNIAEPLRSKAFISRITKGRNINCGGTWRNDRLETRVRDFGDYSVQIDTVPPVITPVGWKTDMRQKGKITFRINDNFRTGGAARSLRYRGTVDGKWILFELDGKTARLTHTFDNRIAPGEHTLKLVVTDDRNNSEVFERIFIR